MAVAEDKDVTLRLCGLKGVMSRLALLVASKEWFAINSPFNNFFSCFFVLLELLFPFDSRNQMLLKIQNSIIDHWN